MTNENFEKYLALLKGLLKLGDSQKEEISCELRDHLEQRVEELVSEGVSADKAELIAIKEFGDAAGMASSFVNISRFKRQRWIMRFTTFAVAGCFVVALFLMSMWPQNGPVQISNAEAQQDPAANVKQAIAKPSVSGQAKKRPLITVAVSKTRTAAEELAHEALDEVFMSLAVVDSPLNEVLEKLSNDAGVRIMVNKAYVEDSGFSLDEPVTLDIQNAKLSTILEMVFRDQLGLDDWVYGVKDSFIYISGQDKIHELMEVRVYDCSDFAVTATYKVPIHSGGGFGGGFGGQSGGGQQGGGQGGGGGFFYIPSSPMVQGLGGGGGFGGGGGTPPAKSKPAIVQGGQQNIQSNTQFGSGSTADNLTVGFKTFENEDLSVLIECVETTVDPESWSQMGGVATLSQVGTALVVNQTIENHREIEELLAMLRKIK